MRRQLRASEYDVARENLYFILSSLSDARGRIAEAGKSQLPLLGVLYSFLQLHEFRVDGEKLGAFLRENRADDEDVRLSYSYFTVCCCALLCEGRDGVTPLRAAARFDWGKITSDCSPLEGRLNLYRDYELSDESTRAIYRQRLRTLAGKRGKTPEEYLSEIPYSEFSRRLLDTPNTRKTRYFALLSTACAALIILCGFCTKSVIGTLLCALPLYEAARVFTDFIFRGLLKPRPVARIKAESRHRTLLVITSLMDGGGEDAADRLEKYFLCNQSDTLYAGILADLPDSDTRTESEDERRIKRLEGKIDALNDKYGERFFLFYRGREYSASEGKYIAPERKRGAVCELVRQLHDGSSALRIHGAADKLTGIRYLMTLDYDTELMPGELSGLMRAALHPYNRAEVDENRRIVTSGHGIFQPAISIKLKSALKTPFSFFFSGDAGFASYSGARFDVYDAVFGTCNFCGKGLIDVRAFYSCALGVFPKESILSHDTAEGCRLRCGCIPDETLYEEAPRSAYSYFRRLHRWIRGDVQSLCLLGGKVKNENGERLENPLSAFDKYRLCDAVLSALVPVSAVFAVGFSMFFSAFSAAAAFFALLYLFLPPLFRLCNSVVFGSLHPGRRFGSLYASDTKKEFILLVLKMSFLFFEAQTALSALLTAGVRMFSRKKLLKWTTAATTDLSMSEPFSYFFGFLPSCIFGMFALLLSGSVVVGIFGILAAVSPITAYLSSKPFKERKRTVRDEEKLLCWVKDSYKYFTDFVTAEHSFLPPDNFQETAGVGIAPRTSPTNIGLYLLSTLSMCDLGLMTPRELCDRLEPTLKTLCRLPKYNGKLYNWYDTRTCAVISGFVSTVDCGNYLASLLTLEAGLREYEPYDPRLPELISQTEALAAECDLSELYCQQRNLFYIGIGQGADNCYDMYESEMRLTDITAVALGCAPAAHLSALAAPIAAKGGRMGVASWGGTAFEYFMPLLFLPAPRGSLSYEAARFAYRQQRAKKARFGSHTVSGTSESCYFEFDARMNYQYKAHGVQSLSVQSSVDSELVLSPYSSFLMLAAGDKPLNDLSAFQQEGAYGKYGFYEAVDFTPTRVGDGAAIIKCYMAHHIGMSVIAACNYCRDSIFVKRF